MRLQKTGFRYKYTSIIMFLYCLSIVAATFVRWLNWFNVALLIIILLSYLKRGISYRFIPSVLWSTFIFAYPICDVAMRGANGLSLYNLLRYLTPMLFLLANVELDNYGNIFIMFVKYFAWFQAFGVFLERVWSRAYILLAWRILGMWSYGVTGFATDATITAYILCFAIGWYLIEYWLIIEKKEKRAWKKLICAAILFGAMILTNKRSLLVGMIGGLILVFLGQSFRSWRKMWKTLGGSVIVVVSGVNLCLGAYHMGMNNALSRMGETFIGLSRGDDVTSMRSVWAAYMNEWRKGSEVLGIGWGNFSSMLSQTSYAGKVPNGHNVYKQILCEEGYVGEMIFVLLLAVVIIFAVKSVIVLSKKNNIRILSFAMFAMFSIVLFAIYCYSGNAIYDTVIYAYFFAAIQLLAAVNKSQKRFDL